MCGYCVPVEFPPTVWEAIDALLCVEWAQRSGLNADPDVDQLRAKIRDLLDAWDGDLFEFYIDRIRERLGVQ